MADRMTVAAAAAAVYDRAAAAFTTAAVWPTPPTGGSRLPAVWIEPLRGGGTPRNRDVTIRVVYVPTPQTAGVQTPGMWAAVDELDAAFTAPLPGGVVTAATDWTIDAVDVDTVSRDAVLYDLTLTYPTC